MPIKVAAKDIPLLHVAINGGDGVVGILHLSPPPSLKARYVLAKASKVIAAEMALFQEKNLELITRHAKKNADGESIKQELENGNAIYQMVDPKQYKKEYEEMFSEPVELIGIRQLTHAELGDCPLTAFHESILLGNILEDKEPE